jgi:Tol biopolymer transport system component
MMAVMSMQTLSAHRFFTLWALLFYALTVSVLPAAAQTDVCTGQLAISGYDNAQEEGVILIYDPAAGTFETLTRGYYVWEGLAWSPDGAHIAWAGSVGDSIGRVFTASVTTGEVVALGVDRAERPRWSPDGAHLAYVDETGVHVVTPDGTSVYSFEGAGAYRQYAAWLDADTLYVDAETGQYSESVLPMFVLRLSDGAQFEHFEFGLGGFGFDDLVPSYSSEALAFYGGSNPTPDTLYIYDPFDQTPEAEGVTTRELAPGDPYNRTAYWSPDGAVLAYQMWLGGGYDILLYTPGEGSTSLLLPHLDPETNEFETEAGRDVAFALLGWSPDGSEILIGGVYFPEAGDDGMNLYTLALDGSPPTLLLDGETSVEGVVLTDAAWSRCLEQP